MYIVITTSRNLLLHIINNLTLQGRHIEGADKYRYKYRYIA